MTTERPYGDRLTTEAALEEIRRCAGTQFDPDVVKAFCTAHAEHASERADDVHTTAA